MEAVESSQRVDHGKPQLNEDALVAKDATSKEPLSEDNPVAAPVSKDEEIKEEVGSLQPEHRDRDALNVV